MRKRLRAQNVQKRPSQQRDLLWFWCQIHRIAMDCLQIREVHTAYWIYWFDRKKWRLEFATNSCRSQFRTFNSSRGARNLSAPTATLWEYFSVGQPIQTHKAPVLNLHEHRSRKILDSACWPWPSCGLIPLKVQRALDEQIIGHAAGKAQLVQQFKFWCWKSSSHSQQSANNAKNPHKACKLQRFTWHGTSLLKLCQFCNAATLCLKDSELLSFDYEDVVSVPPFCLIVFGRASLFKFEIADTSDGSQMLRRLCSWHSSPKSTCT